MLSIKRTRIWNWWCLKSLVLNLGWDQKILQYFRHLISSSAFTFIHDAFNKNFVFCYFSCLCLTVSLELIYFYKINDCYNVLYLFLKFVPWIQEYSTDFGECRIYSFFYSSTKNNSYTLQSMKSNYQKDSSV